MVEREANRFNRVLRDPNPVIGSNDVVYELAERSQAINYAGVSAMVKLAKHVGLVNNIDKHVDLLKCHAPYHESDHLLAIAIYAMCNGTRLEHMELLRNDSAFLDALGVKFQFGYEAKGNLVKIADELTESAWKKLDRPLPARKTGEHRTKPKKMAHPQKAGQLRPSFELAAIEK